MSDTPDDKRQNRKNRRKKWEKLRESPIIGIETLPSGGLVSAQISGKALGGRIGRRIGGGSRHQNMNPATARNADNDPYVLEGIPTINRGRGVLDPTPGSAISGRMAREQNKEEFVGVDNILRKHFAQFAKFQEWTRNKDWRAFHRNHFDWWMFPIPRGSNTYRDEYNIAGEPLAELLQNNRYMSTLPAAMKMYLRSIGWDMDNEQWIPDADVAGGQEPLRSLNQARLYKIAQSAEAHNLDKPLRSISRMVDDMMANGIRVGNENYWTSISGRMTNDGRLRFPENPNLGDKYQTDDPEDTRRWVFDGKLWVRTDEGGKKARTLGWRKAGGSSGKTISPSASSIRAGSSRAMKYGTQAFEDLWKRRDSENENAEGNNLTFNWKDEDSRLLYLSLFGKFPNKHPVSRKSVGWAKFADGLPPGTYQGGNLHSWIPEVKQELKALGISITPQEHPKMGDQYGSWIAFSGSPGASAAEGASAKQLLSHLAETISPDTFYEHFEAWIRNPFITAEKNGKQVGIRLAFNNDKERLLNEYRRRVVALRDALYSHFGNDIDDVAATMVKDVVDDSVFTGAPSQTRQSSGNDWADINANSKWAAKIIADEAKAIVAAGVPRSKDRLAALLDKNLSVKLPEEIRQLIVESDSLVETMLRDVFKDRQWGRDAEFDTPDILPYEDDETLELVKELAEQFIYKLEQDTGEPVTEITQRNADDFSDSIGDETVNRAGAKPLLDKTLSGIISGRMGGISGKMGNGPEPDTEAPSLGYDPENPEHLGNHFTSRPEGYDKRPEPVDTPAEARATGAPLKGLVPGNYHPEIQEKMNDMIDKVIEHNWHNQMQTMPTHYMGLPTDIPEIQAAKDLSDEFRAYFGAWTAGMQSLLRRLYSWDDTDFDLTEDQLFLIRQYLTPEKAATVKKFSDIPTEYEGHDGRMYDMTVLRNLIGGLLPIQSQASHGNEIGQISDGLAQRAIHAGIRINNLRRLELSEMDRATEDLTDWWTESIEAALLTNSNDDSIGNAWSYLEDEVSVSIGMPLEGILSMFRDGEFKTVFETRTSRGNENTAARATAEFAMFGILPSYSGKRPIYGVLNVGPPTRDALDNTNQYGPFIIVLKPDVNKNATWTEGDSLSLMSSASTLDNPSHHSLFQQRLMLDVPFIRTQTAFGGRGMTRETPDGVEAIGQFQYAEAQIHRPVTPDDIAYIIIDTTQWSEQPDTEFPVVGTDGFPLEPDTPEYDAAEMVYPADIMNYDGFIQISKIAESLNIPLILTDDIDQNSGSYGNTIYGPEYL